MSKVKKELRQQIKEHRGYKCDECELGDSSTRFCFQRKVNHKRLPELANEPGNIMMLCEDCHRVWEEGRASNRRPGAKVNYKFRKRIRAERGNECEICGRHGLSQDEWLAMSAAEKSMATLHVHHKNKQRTHPQIRCDRDNLVLCCQSCHVRLEAELDAKLREQGAVDSKIITSVDHLEGTGATYNPSTAGLNPEARVLRGGAFAPPLQRKSGWERSDPKPDGEDAAKGSGRTQEPAAEPETTAVPPQIRVNTYFSAPLNLKLRQQAAKLGLKPGSPRWRAYVLGTVDRAAKEKRKKAPKCL